MSVDNSKLSFRTAFRYEHIAKNSNGNLLKGNVIIASSNSSVTVPHNLGYVPYCKVFYEYPAGTIMPALATAGAFIEVDFVPTTTGLTITAYTNYETPAFSNLKVYYRIYEESIT